MDIKLFFEFWVLLYDLVLIVILLFPFFYFYLKRRGGRKEQIILRLAKFYIVLLFNVFSFYLYCWFLYFKEGLFKMDYLVTFHISIYYSLYYWMPIIIVISLFICVVKKFMFTS